MKFKIVRKEPYTPAELEGHRKRMTEQSRRQHEYDEPGARRATLVWAIFGALVLAGTFWWSWGYWKASDTLLRLGS